MRTIARSKLLLTISVAVVLLLSLIVVPAMAQIPVFSPFNGTVTIDGADAPVGTVIEAYVGMETTARATFTVETAAGHLAC